MSKIHVLSVLSADLVYASSTARQRWSWRRSRKGAYYSHLGHAETSLLLSTGRPKRAWSVREDFQQNTVCQGRGPAVACITYTVPQKKRSLSSFVQLFGLTERRLLVFANASCSFLWAHPHKPTMPCNILNFESLFGSGERDALSDVLLPTDPADQPLPTEPEPSMRRRPIPS